MNDKEARELQLKVMKVFEKDKIYQLQVYAILDDLVNVLKKYLKEEEDLDIDKLFLNREKGEEDD